MNLKGSIAGVAVLLFCLACWQALVHPRTPLPPEWNPLQPLDVAAPVTFVTDMKLRRAVQDGARCRAALATAARFEARADREDSDVCHIRDRVALRAVSGAEIAALDTTCEAALRLAMWVEHGVQPAAREHFGQEVTGLRQQGSYNCRPIRGGSTRMSTHARADAIDIAGVTLADGRRLELLTGWEDGPFWPEVRDGACRWFGTVLGPDYNALHRDHFHLQNRGGACR